MGAGIVFMHVISECRNKMLDGRAYWAITVSPPFHRQLLIEGITIQTLTHNCVDVPSSVVQFEKHNWNKTFRKELWTLDFMIWNLENMVYSQSKTVLWILFKNRWLQHSLQVPRKKRNFWWLRTLWSKKRALQLHSSQGLHVVLLTGPKLYTIHPGLHLLWGCTLCRLPRPPPHAAHLPRLGHKTGQEQQELKSASLMFCGKQVL